MLGSFLHPGPNTAPAQAAGAPPCEPRSQRYCLQTHQGFLALSRVGPHRTFCDRRVRLPPPWKQKALRATVSGQGCVDPENVEPGFQRGAHLAGSAGGGWGGALDRDPQGVSGWKVAKCGLEERSWVEGRCAWPALQMRAPRTQSSTCQAPRKSSACLVLPGLALCPQPAAATLPLLLPPSLPPSGASGPVPGTAALQQQAEGGLSQASQLELLRATFKLLDTPWQSGPMAPGVLNLSDKQRTGASS